MNVLLINPWIQDFAAFDLWAGPLGLLYLSSKLRAAGIQTRLVDCLDRLHPRSKVSRRRRAWPLGTGQWHREPTDLPPAYQGIPRQYSRYGLPEAVFIDEAAKGPRPDAILVTSGMTYWYPGPFRAIQLARRIWPDAPIVLGGIYASLCPEHARNNSGADLVVTGPGEKHDWLKEIGIDPEDDGRPSAFGPESSLPSPGLWPDIDLYPHQLESAPLLTSRGCPGRCPYCASRRLFSGFVQRPADDVLAEIEDRRHRLHIRNFAFFDDALLERSDRHIVPILEEVVRRDWDLGFHCPNGLHVRSISRDLARLMRAAGFETLRLGLETLDSDRRKVLGPKALPEDFLQAVNNLKSAGFEAGQIGAYILYGLPDQPLREVLDTARAVKEVGARPYLAEYSPLPGTPLWESAIKESPFDLENEPLYHNNTFFPCRGSDFSWETVWRIKRTALDKEG